MEVRRLVVGVLLTLCAACSGDDGGPERVSKDWTVVREGLPASLLSVWASSDSDVWVVGGDPRDGGGPLVYHYDGAAWTKLDTGLRNVDLWWVYGFENGPIYMSGSNGTIVQYKEGAFTTMPTPATPIVFGMWGAAANDVWAVGGNFGGSGFAWHYDGYAWLAQLLPPGISEGTIWKVGGRSGTDLWMSCTNGTTLHWDGSALASTTIDTDSSLFSVGGDSDRFITVGGAFDGEIYENDGTAWKSVLPRGLPPLTGVSVHDDVSLAVGSDGIVLRRGTDGTWSPDPHVTDQHLHAAFIDPAGEAWSVGGEFNAAPTRSGVLLHAGTELQGAFP